MVMIDRWGKPVIENQGAGQGLDNKWWVVNIRWRDPYTVHMRLEAWSLRIYFQVLYL